MTVFELGNIIAERDEILKLESTGWFHITKVVLRLQDQMYKQSMVYRFLKKGSAILYQKKSPYA
jgi:hypothetical protein